MITLHNLPMGDISCLDNDIACKVVCFYKEWNQRQCTIHCLCKSTMWHFCDNHS